MTDASSFADPASLAGAPTSRIQPRAWPLILAATSVVVFWVFYIALGLGETHMFARWLLRMAGLLITSLLMLLPWFFQRDLSLKWRFAYLLLAIVGLAVPILLRDHTLMPVTPVEWSLEVLITLGVIWLWASRHATVRTKQWGFVAVLLLSWIPALVVRGEGLTGDGKYDLRWRWTATSEEKFLESQSAGKASATLPAQQPEQAPAASAASSRPAQPLVVSTGDWPVFRGPTGDSQVHGVKLATDWQQHPPVQVWKHAIGPAWSSILVVGDRLFTQEQRGDVESTVCYSATDGRELWSYDTKSRFEEPLAGVGPRATPTFHDGRIYSLGARGRLDAIDALTGKLLWTRDAFTECAATIPMWGYSVSPVVSDGNVVVFIGGAAQEALVAYRADDGQQAWKTAVGRESYSSPILLTIHDVPQLLYLGDTKLVSVLPASGKILWEFANPANMGRPTCQPQLVDDSHLLVSFEPGSLLQIEITKAGDTWSTRQLWKTIAIKPDFSDYLAYDGHVYGFDADIFCCIDLASGKRKWKAGRYGAGQALLFADQGVILVLSEKGELILVPCDPQKHRELARFQAIEGKTWNHPSFSRGQVFVRNAEEMACFKLTTE